MLAPIVKGRGMTDLEPASGSDLEDVLVLSVLVCTVRFFEDADSY